MSRPSFSVISWSLNEIESHEDILQEPEALRTPGLYREGADYDTVVIVAQALQASVPSIVMDVSKHTTAGVVLKLLRDSCLIDSRIAREIAECATVEALIRALESLPRLNHKALLRIVQHIRLLAQARGNGVNESTLSRILGGALLQATTTTSFRT
jgi:hypothetical protein